MKIKFVILLLFLFFIPRILYMLLYPLFTDESLYIRWGQLMVSNPAYTWISLRSIPKQPFALWLFGGAAYIFHNSTVAPRIVSLIFAVCSVILCYFWMALRKSTAVCNYALTFLAVTPLFIHFGSIAIMESMVICFTILLFFLQQVYTSGHKKSILVFIGCVMGIGFWIKTNTLIVSIIIYASLVQSLYSQKISYLRKLFVLCIPAVSAFFVVLPLLLHPDVALLISDTQHFTFSIRELTQIPYKNWTYNCIHFILATSLYLGPAGVIGLVAYLVRYGFKINRFLLISSCLIIASVLLNNKILSTRYYISAYIPLIPLISVGLHSLSSRAHLRFAAPLLLLLNFTLSNLCIFNPPWYFNLFPTKFSQSERDYAFGASSGYASREIFAYIQSSIPKPTILLVPDRSGNPTDYMIAGYFNTPGVLVRICDSEADFRSISTQYRDMSLYYVSREGIPNEYIRPHLVELKKFASPGNGEKFSIYKVKHI